jgi:hypothetical protein
VHINVSTLLYIKEKKIFIIFSFNFSQLNKFFLNMSNNKRKFVKTRESFSNIISGADPFSTIRAPTSTTPAPTASTSKKKRKTQPISGSQGGSEGDGIQTILEEILRQNSKMNAKIDELLGRVRIIEENLLNVDKAFIKVINFFNLMTLS